MELCSFRKTVKDKAGEITTYCGNTHRWTRPLSSICTTRELLFAYKCYRCGAYYTSYVEIDFNDQSPICDGACYMREPGSRDALKLENDKYSRDRYFKTLREG